MQLLNTLLAVAVSFLVAEGIRAQSQIPNVEQVPGRLLAGPFATGDGRTAVLAIHEGYLWQSPESPGSLAESNLLVRAWDISSVVGGTPETRQLNVVQKQVFGVSAMPIDAHGSVKSNEHLHLGSFNRSYRLDLETGDFVQETRPPWLYAHTFGNVFSPWGMNKFDTYTPPLGFAQFRKVDAVLATWDHIALTGVIGHPFLLGNILYEVSEGSRTGIAAYDMTLGMDESLPADQRVPVLLDILTDGAPGGYQAEMWAGGGKLYVVFPYRTAGNGVRVADVTDPSDMKFIADFSIQSTDQSMYLQFQDDYAFVCGSKIDMRTFEEELTLDLENTPHLDDPAQSGFSASQSALPAGNLVITGGYGARQGIAIWAHQAEPDTSPPTVAYHTPKANQSGYSRYAPISLMIHETLEMRSIRVGETFLVQSVLGDGSLGVAVTGDLIFSYNDFLTFTPHQALSADTTYEVTLTENGIRDVVGNGMAEYAFRFSTGGAINVDNHLPVITSFDVTSSPSLPGANVDFSIVASDVDAGDVLEYRFDAGDGSPRSEWQASPDFSHIYAEIGHYNVLAQVRDESGLFTSSSRKVTIMTESAAVQPTKSSQLVILPALGDVPASVWCVNPDNDTLTQVDLTSNTLIQEIDTGDDPRSIAIAADGSLWVACHDGDEIRIYNPEGIWLQTFSLPYGSAPIALCPTPNGDTMLCSMSGSGRLFKYDTVTRMETGNLELGPTARAISITSDGSRALVTRFISPEHHGEVWDVQIVPFTLTRMIPLLKNRGGRMTQDNSGGARGVPNYLSGITIAPGDGRAWVASKQDNTGRGLLFGGYPADLTHDSTVRAVISQIDLTSNKGVIDNTIDQFALSTVGRMDVDNAAMPKAIAFSPLGDYMFVAMEGNNAVVIYDALSFDHSSSGVVVGRVNVGMAPQGIVVDASSNTLWVKNLMGRSVSALDINNLIAVGSVQLPHNEVTTVGNEKMDAQVILGKRVFYNASDTRMSAEGYISCASCHSDGGQDGRNWDFTGRGEGLRNTIALNGRSGNAHGRMHWTGNFDEVQDFENDIRNAFGGLGFLSDGLWSDPEIQDPLGTSPKAGHSQELDALAAYLASLASQSVPRSAFRAADGSLTPEALAGQAHFTSQNCGSCHVPESEFRDGLVHDVGTFLPLSGLGLNAPLVGIDTPTLIDVSRTAPYLHHGVAARLEDVFRIAGGARYEAESLPAVGSVSYTTNALSLLINHDNASIGGRLNGSGSGLEINLANGGAGGAAGVLIRAYSTRFTPHSITVTANAGTLDESSAAGVLERTISSTGFQHIWIEGFDLLAGANNTVTITANAGWPNLFVDQITLANADDLALAQDHRTVLSLSESEQAELMAYVRQIGVPESSLPAIDQWRQSHFPADYENASIAGDNDDPDADGLVNMMEYFLGTDPNVRNSESATSIGYYTENGTDYVSFVFQRELTALGHIFEVHVSTDLVNWAVPSEQIVREVSRAGSMQHLEILIPIDPMEKRHFMRLSIER